MLKSFVVCFREAYRERDSAGGGSNSRGSKKAWPVLDVPEFYGHVTLEHMKMWDMLEQVLAIPSAGCRVSSSSWV